MNRIIAGVDDNGEGANAERRVCGQIDLDEMLPKPRLSLCVPSKAYAL